MRFMKEVCQNTSKKAIYNKKNTKKFPTHTYSPRFAPIPIQKILGTPLLCPVLKMKSSPLHLCVMSLCVYTVGFIL